MTRPLVLSRLEAAPGWSARLPRYELGSTDGLPRDLHPFDSAWIDATRVRPLEVARSVHERDPALQVVVVAPPEDLSLHERALLFTPGLGEVWLTEPDGVGEELLTRAREVTGARRRYRGSEAQVSQTLASFNGTRPNRAVVSDAYLAALLDVLPDPVISVDEAGTVVSWSNAAEAVLGVPRRDALGRPVLEVLRAHDPDALERVLGEGLAGPARTELEIDRGGERLAVQAVVTQVEAGGVRVRSLVLRDVTRERAALERLERAVETRSRFYAAMSHEIRTPINAIMGYNELLQTLGDDVSKRSLYLQRSQKAAHHLLALVNDVLDLSKLESDALEVQRERVLVSALITDLVATVEPLAREQGTTLEVEYGAAPMVLSTDPRRAQQILINLASNALKFGEGRPVLIRCFPEGGWAVFEVEDHGRGIAPGDLHRIFEEFTQVEGTQGGTGLGLPISRKLAELLGGHLGVESTPGEGSTFRLRLPLESAG